MNRPSPEIYRLFDASMNRACEGIRVLEDTARMIFDHAEMTSRLKSVRHELMRATASVPGLDIDAIMARGSERDVLRSGEIPSEATRTGFTDIVQANSGRAQEALRSLEEYAKLIAPGLSERYKSVRFSLYDCEQELMAIVMHRDVVDQDRISRGLIVPVTVFHSANIGDICRDYGIEILILNPDYTSDRDNMYMIIDAIQSLRDLSVNVLIRGRTDIALVASADGVMLDDSHVDPRLCRQVIGAKGIIAATTPGETDSRDSDAIDIHVAFTRDALSRTDGQRAGSAQPGILVTSDDSFEHVPSIPECDGIWIEIRDADTDKIRMICKRLKW